MREMSFWFYICYPFSICCPCLTSKRQQKEIKERRFKRSLINEKKAPVDTRNWEQTDREFTPSQIKDKDLTKVYKIPEQYETEEQCLNAQGFVYNINDLIGKGTYGQVYKVLEKRSGTVMAVKKIKTGDWGRDPEVFESLKSELFVMIKMKRHKHIVQVVRHFIISAHNRIEYCYLFMEYANGDTLLAKMAEKRFAERIAKNYFFQIVIGLKFLHFNKIAHKDLKLENILIFIESNGIECLKITDFGLSRVRYDEQKGCVIKDSRGDVGTVDYMSPQILKIHIYEKFNVKVAKLRKYDPFIADYWALGVCLYIMISAEKPFIFSNNPKAFIKMYNNMMNRNYKISDNTRHNYSNDCLDLISQLLEPVVTKRLSLRFVLIHKWLKDCEDN